MALVVAALAAPAAVAAPAAPPLPPPPRLMSMPGWPGPTRTIKQTDRTSGRARNGSYETYITDDTAQITADAGATMTKLQVAQAKQAAEFAKVPGLRPKPCAS
jgi:peptidyl-dipeptidase A